MALGTSLKAAASSFSRFTSALPAETRLSCIASSKAPVEDPLSAVREEVANERRRRQMIGAVNPSPLKFVLLGGPGAGKGTWGSLMAKLLSIPHISTGDLLRAELSKALSLSRTTKEAKLHRQVAATMSQGKLLPDHLILELLSMRLQTTDPSVGFILDGFPRTLPQAKLLNDVAGGIDLALHFHLDDDILIAKCLGRRICSDCGQDYNLSHVDISKTIQTCHGIPVHKRTFLPACLPPEECIAKLKVRPDDSDKAIVLKRLQVYLREVNRMKQYYSLQGKLTVVDAGLGAEYVWDRLSNVIRGLELSMVAEVASS